MEIYFVRHGQTVWNVEKRFQGLSDSPLTELGITQAKLLGEKLKDIKFDKFYSTSLKRANDTANYIKGNREQEVEIFDDFEENKLVFFEANETVMISIGFGSNNYGKIYYYDMEISKNLKEFFDKLLEDDTFYYNLF